MEFPKYPKIKRLGYPDTAAIWDDKVVVEEKIDGANFRFMYDPDQEDPVQGIRWGTRNVDYTNVPQDSWPKRFVRQWEWVIEHAEDIQKYAGYVFYAEAVLPHTIQYDWDKFPAPLLGFDVLSPDGTWVPYPENKKIFEDIGLPFVPVIGVLEERPTVEQFEELVPKSQFYDGIAEGVVLKNYGNGVFAKVLSEKFVETNRNIFGKSKKELSDETEKWFEYLFSPRRIEKVIQRLVDEEGRALDMRLMRDLIYTVMEDAIVEEGLELVRKAEVVDFKKIRKMLSKRCQNVLQRMMVEATLLDNGG